MNITRGPKTIELVPNKWLHLKSEVSDELKIYDYLIQIYCVIENKVLPYAERALLTYYTKYGINKDTEKLFAEDYNRTKQIVANLKTGLSKKGLIIKDADMNSWQLSPFLKKKREDSLTLILEFNVTK